MRHACEWGWREPHNPCSDVATLVNHFVDSEGAHSWALCDKHARFIELEDRLEDRPPAYCGRWSPLFVVDPGSEAHIVLESAWCYGVIGKVTP